MMSCYATIEGNGTLSEDFGFQNCLLSSMPEVSWCACFDVYFEFTNLDDRAI